MSRKIVIEPVTRVEGHGKVTIQLDDKGQVERSRLHIVEFRGFERFVQGRPYWEAPVLVQRLCGICPVSHHLAAAKAMDMVVGAGAGDGLPPTAEKMRLLMHYGQIFQSHSLHFFHLASPDLLFGYDSPPEQRNVIGVIAANRELATQAVLMRKFGQEVIAVTAGKKIHGTGAVPGGINKNLSVEERDALLKGPHPMNADAMVQYAQGALAFFKDYYAAHKDFIDNFSRFPSNHLSLVRPDGALDFYHGVLRAVDADGRKILHDVECQEYLVHIREEVRSWSYMKFPYIRHLGPEKGWYRVGPLARLNTVDFIPSPLAQAELEIFRKGTGGRPNDMCMHTHWARLIETLHAAEVIRDLLRDPDLQGGELLVKGKREAEGVGIIEAPRGTLIHHYRVSPDDQIVMANLIVSTTHNNEPMNRAVNHVAKALMTGAKEITEGMMNGVEVAIRAYDPCLSCATHAYGSMALAITLCDASGNVISQRSR
jgi:NAD-reducing hydrogenase large subunit